MADKRAIKVDTLDRLAEGFQESRGITDKLTMAQMIAFAKEPVGGGVNKLAQLVDRTITEVTAEDLGDITRIGENAFYYCRSLTRIGIPSSITEIGSSAFGGVGSITRVDITDLKAWCAINFNNTYDTQYFYANPSSVARGKLYLNGSLVTELTLTEDMTLKNYAFSRNEDLTSLVIQGSYVLPANAFCYCYNLANIDLGKVKQIRNAAFSACESLTNVIIPNSTVEINNSAFASCTNLTTVRIGNGINKIWNSVFQSCGALTDIYIDKEEGSVSGSPWGAPSATVHWNTPLPSEEA